MIDAAKLDSVGDLTYAVSFDDTNIKECVR